MQVSAFQVKYLSAEEMYVENCKIYRRLYDWGYAFPSVIQTSVILSFSTHIFSADISLEMLKLGRVTKVKMLSLVLVYVFNFDLFKFSAAILEKGLLPKAARKRSRQKSR